MGMGFFEHFVGVANLYCLSVQTRDGKKYYLAANEVRNGWLAEEGSRLAAFLSVPFEKRETAGT
jgi:hypothetical protein